MNELQQKRCLPCEGGIPKLTPSTAQNHLAQLSGAWELEESIKVKGHFIFKDFYEAMGFANAVAFIANSENHHPFITIGWGSCDIIYWTHAIQGLSTNDFICAAKIDALYEHYQAPPPLCKIS
ncbi:4a-hydroxytetrahydrobiopterin dehydratase [Magnetococcus sp. PR-3]|uniref:4a-hydroxytetrahydrobiopterin dehydratase n=1 Tax=Magnetococcus sp. PR-3 TaxID=3120355 RepID=UPI002FCE3CDE